jgi:hypothetical protein
MPKRQFPWLACLFADGGYQGPIAAGNATTAGRRLEIVKRSDQAKGFEVIPRRWVIEGADRGEDDRGIGLRGRPFDRASRPYRAEVARKLLRVDVTVARERIDVAALVPRDLAMMWAAAPKP